jgi:hypothetical protein
MKRRVDETPDGTTQLYPWWVGTRTARTSCATVAGVNVLLRR